MEDKATGLSGYELGLRWVAACAVAHPLSMVQIVRSARASIWLASFEVEDGKRKMNINCSNQVGPPRWAKWLGILACIVFFPIGVIIVFGVLFAIMVSG
jgi:hypothetical protein